MSEGRRQGAILATSATRWSGLLVAVGLAGLGVLMSFAFGAASVPLTEVISAFFDYEGSEGEVIVREIRAHRTLLAVEVGMAVAVAGALMQAVTRNPLADPGILGINSGASLLVVGSLFLLGITSPTQYVWFAFLGGAGAALVVYALAGVGSGGASPVKLALAGTTVAILIASFTSSILILDINTLDAFRAWMVGSLEGRDGRVVIQLLPFFVVGLSLAFVLGRYLNAIGMGDEVATSLGVKVGTIKILTGVTVVILAGAAVAAAGPIAFVGLTIPHVARAFVGPDQRWLIPYSATLGAALILFSDVAGRLVVRPGELEVGVVTAVVGGPFFIYLVRRRDLAELR